MTTRPTVLVLGASGLLGYHCQVELEKANYRVIKTYNSCAISYPDSEKLEALGDGDDLLKILLKYQPVAVINNIAYVTVDGCEAKPALAKQLNTDFVQKLVMAMEKAKLNKTHLIHVSTDSVYGDSHNEKPWREEDPTSPLSVYAQTKLSGEAQALRHPKATVLRTAFYGINPYSTKSLLWWIIYNAQSGKILDGWENIYFSPISARSLAKTILQLLSKNITGTYNVGSKDTCNKYDFVNAVCNILNLDTVVNRTTSKQEGHHIRPNYSVLDCSKLAKVLPWDLHWRDDLIAYMKDMPAFPRSQVEEKL